MEECCKTRSVDRVNKGGVEVVTVAKHVLRRIWMWVKFAN